MSLDFKVHPRLKDSEEQAVRELQRQLPFLKRTPLVTGLILMGLSVMRAEDGAQRLLSLLGRRMQAEGGVA
jgi:hypothetical protein